MLWIHNTQWKASEKQSARFQVQILGIRFSWSQTIKQRTGLNASCHTQRHQNRLSRKSQPQHGSPSASKSASSLWVSLPLTTEYPDIVVVHYRCCIGHLAYCSLTKLLDDSSHLLSIVISASLSSLIISVFLGSTKIGSWLMTHRHVILGPSVTSDEAFIPQKKVPTV